MSFGFRQIEPDYEDVAQVLRIKIVQSYRKYDKTRGVASFHTYLHVAMRNATQDFLAFRKKKLGYGREYSLDAALEETFDGTGASNQNSSRSSLGSDFRRFGVEDEYFPCPIALTGAEAVLYNLLMMEMSYAEVYAICTGDVKKTLTSLRRKVKAYLSAEMNGGESTKKTKKRFSKI